MADADLFQNVVEIEEMQLITKSPNSGFMIDSNWKNAEKISLHCTVLPQRNYPSLNPNDAKFWLKFPNLREMTLDLGEQNFLYSNFTSLIFHSHILECLSITFSHRNCVSRFDETDFSKRLTSAKLLRLKLLSLSCSKIQEEPIPFQSLILLVSKCPNLLQLYYNYKTKQQWQPILSKGFSLSKNAYYFMSR